MTTIYHFVTPTLPCAQHAPRRTEERAQQAKRILAGQILARLTFAGVSGFWRDGSDALFHVGTGFSQAQHLYFVPPAQAPASFRGAALLGICQQFLIEPALVLVYAAADSELPFWLLLAAYVFLGRPLLHWLLVLRRLGPAGARAPIETLVEPRSTAGLLRLGLSLGLAALIVIFLSNPARPPSLAMLWPNLLALALLGGALEAQRLYYRRKLAGEAA